VKAQTLAKGGVIIETLFRRSPITFVIDPRVVNLTTRGYSMTCDGLEIGQRFLEPPHPLARARAALRQRRQ